jgi:hypothetical protein
MAALLWLVVFLAVVLCASSYLKARLLSRKLEELTRSYWELRYQHGILRSRVARLDPESSEGESPEPSAAVTAFVPLSSLKK